MLVILPFHDCMSSRLVFNSCTAFRCTVCQILVTYCVGLLQDYNLSCDSTGSRPNVGPKRNERVVTHGQIGITVGLVWEVLENVRGS